MLLAFSISPQTSDQPDGSVSQAVAAVDAVAERTPRISLVMKADTRPGHTGQLTAKVERIEKILDS